MQELKEVAGKLTTEIPDDPEKLRQELPKLLETVGKKGRTVIVLDALNQLRIRAFRPVPGCPTNCQERQDDREFQKRRAGGR